MPARLRLLLRAFSALGSACAPPDHSTISRTRRLFPVETHQAVFTWVLQQLAEAGLVQGKTVGIDATTLEANAAMRSIVRRDTGQDYTAFLTRLAKVSGIETPTAADQTVGRPVGRSRAGLGATIAYTMLYLPTRCEAPP